jgi:hypothetical protein
MNEIARLGIEMPTGPLKDGKAALDALVPSAQKAEKGIERFNAAAHGLTTVTGGAASGVDKVRAAAAAAVAPTDRFGKAALGAGTAIKTVQMAAAGASAPINNLVGGLTRVTTATGAADAHIKAYRASLASVPAAANSAASSLNRLGAAANDNINRLQSTPGNIAAQFQDIGVTAAGGMSPLLIALQQGTQLSSAMQGGVGNLLAGLRQLFNMTTVLTIGLVALVAAGLQMVDWMSVAKTLITVVADGMDTLATAAESASEAIVYFGLVAAVAFGPRILAAVLSLATTIGATLYGMIGRATVAMIVFASANPFGAIVIAIGLVITAMSLLNDKFGGVFTSILKTVRAVANAILRFFMTAFNSIVTAAETVVNGLTSAFSGIARMLGFDVTVGQIDLSGFKFDTSANRDVVGDIGNFVSDTIGSGADMLRGLMPKAATPKGAGASGGASPQQSEAERQAKAYEELTKRAQERINSLTDETMALGMTEAAGARFLAQQELLRNAASQGITLDVKRREELMRLGEAMASAQVDKAVAEQTRAYQEQIRELEQQSELIGLTGRQLVETAAFQQLLNDAVSVGKIDLKNMNEEMRKHILLLRERAGNIAAQSEANRTAEFTADFTRNLELQTAAMERSRGEIGLTGAALTAYRIESDLLNRAARENIELTPEYVESVRQQAARFGELTEQVRLQQQRFDDARESLRGFFGDMVSGLQQGQSVWETFGNAVMNVVNRIINRLLDLAVDQAFNSLLNLAANFGSSGSSGGGGGSNSASKSGDNSKSGGSVKEFAKGGAFTNGIYSDPTVFKFAKGGSFGVMGEAGPEAVMPLKRGSDGSLGVRVTAAEPQTVMVRVTTDDPRFNAYVDDRIGQSAPTVAQAGARISQNETAFKNTRRLA